MNDLIRTVATIAVFAAGMATALADSTEDLHALFDKEWEFRMQEFPESATANGLEGFGDRLTRMSAEDLERRYEFRKGILAELNSIPIEGLDRQDAINHRMFRRQMEHFIIDHEQQTDLIVFNSDWGFWMGWNRMPDETTFRDAGDFEDYLSRLEDMPEVMDEYIALMRASIEVGLTQPQVILEGRDGSISSQVVDQAQDSKFYGPFVEMPDSVSPEQQAALRERAIRVVGESVIPAYAALLEFWKQEYVPNARTTLGAYAWPNGEAIYQEQVRWYATIDMTPAEVHELGLAEVARIRAEMEAIIKEVGFEGSFADFIDFLRTDPQFYAKTAKELLAAASYVAKKADGRLPSLFGKLPRQPYGVAPVPDDLAPFYTTGRAVGAPLNADRGGYYWVNTYELNVRPLYAIPALTLHEAAPGHLMQMGLALEQDEQPEFRRNDYISAFGEGWGLYCEALGVEMDIYETPYEQFGRLTYEMWRAARLVIDTGIHSMGWSREQAQEYLASNTALSIHNVTTEVDRYIGWPGQALSYKLGELTIWRLRREAESALGADFDIKAFHDHLLGLGSVPLDIMEDEMRYWVAEQSSGS